MPIERTFQSNGLLIFCYEDLDLWGEYYYISEL